MRHFGLLWKLLTVNIGILLLVVAVIWWTIDTLAYDYFATLMADYHINPVESHGMFVDAIHRYLVGASTVAIIAGVGLSLLLTRRILRPLRDMERVAGKLAMGDYSARVAITSRDEIGRLAVTIDHMAQSMDKGEKLRRKMVADLAHDLRTPLANLKGYLEALIDKVLPASGENLTILKSETHRLIRLVENLEQLSKADSALLGLQARPVDLGKAVRQTISTHQYQFQSREIRTDCQLPDEGPIIQCDQDRLLQVLGNIVDNACRYTSDGEDFSVDATLDKDCAALTFRNRSTQFQDGPLDELFERFYRPDAVRNSADGGSGLGLSIVRELTQAMGGAVDARQSDGHFILTLNLPYAAGNAAIA